MGNAYDTWPKYCICMNKRRKWRQTFAKKNLREIQQSKTAIGSWAHNYTFISYMHKVNAFQEHSQVLARQREIESQPYAYLSKLQVAWSARELSAFTDCLTMIGWEGIYNYRTISLSVANMISMKNTEYCWWEVIVDVCESVHGVMTMEIDEVWRGWSIVRRPGHHYTTEYSNCGFNRNSCLQQYHEVN